MATVPFQVTNSSIVIEGLVNGQPVTFVVDTGDAIGPTFNASDAKALALPNLGPLDITGAGGSVEISKTQADITLGGTTYVSEPSAIDTNLDGPSLLGLPFFLRQGGILSFDFDNGALSFEACEPTGLWQRLLALLGV